jgi:hypothetical protein
LRPVNQKQLNQMKKVITLVAFAGMLTFVACGPSAEEKAATEKKKQDSIATVEKSKADEIAAAQVAKDKAKQDSTANADKMKQDSIAAAEAGKKGGKKK